LKVDEQEGGEVRFTLRFTPEAARVMADLAADSGAAVKLRKVRRTLARLQENPRHPGLESHQYHSLTGPAGEPLLESYVENRTPRAWRVWWCYGPERGQLTIVTIGPHPD